MVSTFFFFESAINSRHLLHELFINRELKLGNIYRSSSKLISGFHRVPCNEHQSSIKRRNGPAVRCFHVLTTRSLSNWWYFHAESMHGQNIRDNRSNYRSIYVLQIILNKEIALIIFTLIMKINCFENFTFKYTRQI